ncbi:MAG: hypothetical protein ACAI38_25810 [Myxococcota bacterium]
MRKNVAFLGVVVFFLCAVAVMVAEQARRAYEPILTPEERVAVEDDARAHWERQRLLASEAVPIKDERRTMASADDAWIDAAYGLPMDTTDFTREPVSAEAEASNESR